MARYAAIDIGSNSTRMLAAEVAQGSPMRILAADREVTRLGESVFHEGSVDKNSIELVCRVLSRMTEEYRKHNVSGVRAVATSAIRDAKNQAEFLQRASEAAGTPVEIISGREEARLIHLGVEARWPHTRKHILIIDIGGGSAEIIVGRDGHMEDAVSKPLGAVRLRENFTAHDPPTEAELERMFAFIDEKVSPAVKRMGHRKWDRVIATSATASAMLCAINRVSRTHRETADRVRATTAQVRRLYEELCSRNVKGRSRIVGIGPRRAEIIIPGAAVLLAILEAFRVRNVYYSIAGVRDGIIADLSARKVGAALSRLSPDQRKEVERLSFRYGVSKEHARHVASLAHKLFDSLAPLHGLPPDYGKLLEAAAYLHDAGHYVSDTSHHKHSYYIIANSDLSGFRAPEREFIANLCRYHRKALPSSQHTNLGALSADQRKALNQLIPLLRLADNLDRGHTQRVKDLRCKIQDDRVTVQVLSSSRTDLEEWAGARAGDAFEAAYQRALFLEHGSRL